MTQINNTLTFVSNASFWIVLAGSAAVVLMVFAQSKLGLNLSGPMWYTMIIATTAAGVMFLTLNQKLMTHAITGLFGAMGSKLPTLYEGLCILGLVALIAGPWILWSTYLRRDQAGLIILGVGVVIYLLTSFW